MLFATEMWERFGFYTILAVMTLFLQNKTEGFGWTREQATGLWANYLMFVYLTPFLGGLIADRFIGYRQSILIGGDCVRRRDISSWRWARLAHFTWHLF